MILQKVLNFAHKIFSKLESNSEICSNIPKLCELVKKVNLDDIDFEKDILQDNSSFDENVHEAPVGYVHLWDSPLFSMGIFIVRNGEKIPLHNHPNMHGILKVIHGCAEIKSYTEINKGDNSIPEQVKHGLRSWEVSNIKCVKQHETVLVDKESDPCVLSPINQNIHEVTANGETTAFLDILGPPYDDTHICQYYRIINPQRNQIQVKKAAEDNADIKYLTRIEQPHGFFCQSVRYIGRSLRDPSKNEDDRQSLK